MPLRFYSQENALVDPDHYLEYMEIEPESLHYLESFEQSEGRLLHPWVEACKRQHLHVGNYFEDTVLKHEELALALSLLEHCYHEMTKRSVFGEDREVPASPYRKMANVIQIALHIQRGLIGLCD